MIFHVFLSEYNFSIDFSMNKWRSFYLLKIFLWLPGEYFKTNSYSLNLKTVTSDCYNQ